MPTSNADETRDRAGFRKAPLCAMMVVLVSMSFLSACHTPDQAEAEARRMELLKQGNPSLYELERRQQLQD